MDISHALREAARAIEASGHASRPRREAEKLLAHALGVEASYLLGHPEQLLADGESDTLASLLARRAKGEPIAHLVGWDEFCGRRFAVSHAVLIPRPETEMIAALARAAPGPARIADIGTGSGCLAITLALEMPRALVVGSDISAEALAVARANAARHGARVAWLRGDGLDAFAGASFDLLVANPPYVDPADAPSLSLEVRGFEPAVALYSERGAAHIASWLSGAARVLASRGRLLMEIGAGQAQAAADLVASEHALRLVAIHNDFAGIERVIEVVRDGERQAAQRSRAAAGAI